MKRHFHTGFLLVCLCFLGMATFSQQTLSNDARPQRPSLFTGLAAKAVCNRPELEKITQLVKSQQVSIQLTDHLTFSGEVIDRVDAPGIQSWNIRLSNFGNALLNVSVINQADRTRKLIGRVIHPGQAEALVIEEENGKYYVTKHKMEFFMVE